MRRIAALALVLLLLPAALAATSTSTASDGRQIRITLINQEPDPVAPGGQVDARFRIENIGSSPARNVEARIESDAPIIVYDENIRQLGTIAGGQADDIGVREKWRLRVDPAAADGENLIELWYRVDGGPWARAGEYVIEVGITDAVLAINRISAADKVLPGVTSTIGFELENMASTTLSDIKLDLEVLTSVTTSTSVEKDELPFTPIGSSNEKSLALIRPGQRATVSFDLFVDADAASKVYKVPYTLTYRDESGTAFEREGIVGLLVDADPDLTISIEQTDILSDGEKGMINVKFVNKGFSDVKFLDIVLVETDEFDVLSNQDVYIGNLDSDDFETAEFELLVDKGTDGPLRLPLRLDYRDANGHLYEEQRELELPLYSGMELSARQENGGSPLLGVVIVLVIAGGGIWWWRRRRKKKHAR